MAKRINDTGLLRRIWMAPAEKCDRADFFLTNGSSGIKLKTEIVGVEEWKTKM
jgi:hypothetical protein